MPFLLDACHIHVDNSNTTKGKEGSGLACKYKAGTNWSTKVAKHEIGEQKNGGYAK
jgi:hypothetical protein